MEIIHKAIVDYKFKLFAIFAYPLNKLRVVTAKKEEERIARSIQLKNYYLRLFIYFILWNWIENILTREWWNTYLCRTYLCNNCVIDSISKMAKFSFPLFFFFFFFVFIAKNKHAIKCISYCKIILKCFTNQKIIN